MIKEIENVEGSSRSHVRIRVTAEPHLPDRHVV